MRAQRGLRFRSSTISWTWKAPPRRSARRPARTRRRTSRRSCRCSVWQRRSSVGLLEAGSAAGDTPVTVANVRDLVQDLLVRLDAPAGRIEMAFPFFVRKTAPVSGVASLLDYEARIEGALSENGYLQTVAIAVPVTSLCPCSKEISDYGAHSQRSVITIAVREREPVSLGEIIRIAETEASAELYGILKRADEKYVTELAYNNPRFVEDLVRGVAARLTEDSRIDGFVVEAENFESIHNHSAYARIARNF